MIDTGRVPLSQAELAIYRQGLSHASAGELQIAVDCYQQLLALRSDFWEAWYECGTTLEDLGRFTDAIHSYDRALALQPKRDALANLWLRRGNTFQYGLGEYDEALACYDRVLQLQPEQASPWYHRGNALWQGYRQPSMAISSYQRALDLDPDFVLSWRNQGNALVELKRYDEAIACYDRALKLSPQDEISAQARYRAQQQLGLDAQPPTTQPAWEQNDITRIPGDGLGEIGAKNPMPPYRSLGANLVIEDESGSHIVVLSGKLQTLGRDPLNDIGLRSQFVSRHHAVIEQVIHPEGYPVFQIRDGNIDGKRSTNGILINGQQVQKAFLRHQDLIVFGPKARAVFREG